MENKNIFNLYLLKFGIKGSEQQGIALISAINIGKATKLLNSNGSYRFFNKYDIYEITCILESVVDTEILINETIFPFEV